MKKTFALLILVFAMLLSACSGPASSVATSTNPTPSAAASVKESTPSSTGGEIVIGSILDTSGNMAVAGQATVWGADYAVEQINKNGGINGKTLRIIHYDVKGDPNEAINAYNRLVDQDKAVAIVGPGLSNIGIAVAPIAEGKKVPIVGHFMDERATTNEQTGEKWNYMFLAEPSCNQQATIIAAYSVNELKIKTAAILYDSSNAYSVTHALPFKEYCIANSVEIVAEESFGKDAKDYKAQLSKIISKKPDAVFIPAYVQQNALAFTQIRQLGYTGLVVGNNTYNPPFNTLTEGTPLKDLYFILNVDFTSEYTKFLGDAYKAAKNGEQPAPNVAFGYDAVTIIANGIANATDPTSGEAIAAAISTKTVDLMTSSGPITIDSNTHRPVGMGVYIAQWNEDATQINLLQYYKAE